MSEWWANCTQTQDLQQQLAAKDAEIAALSRRLEQASDGILLGCSECTAKDAEIERLARLLAEPNSVKIEAAINGEFYATIEHWGVAVIASSLASTLKELGGENFVTMECAPTERSEAMVVTIRRKHGKTPEELWRQATDTLASKDAEIERLTQAVAYLRAYAFVTLEHLDAGRAEKAGLQLAAMSGHLPGYDAKLDEIFQRKETP
jgi:hypothetical protein